MKKKLISAAILLGVSTVAMGSEENPMLLNADGLGQVLLYPYYNVNDGFDTAFTVVNTSNTTRAVKVRIVEGKNSWEVLDFNLYMSPNDTWQGMLHKHEDGKIELITADTSCTLPKLNDKKNPAYLRATNLLEVEAKQPRRTSLFTGNPYKKEEEREAEYGNPDNLIKRLSEGYIEVIDMGVIPAALPTELKDGNAKYVASLYGEEASNKAEAEPKIAKAYKDYVGPLLKGIEHVNGVPGDCDVIKTVANDVWKDNSPDVFIYHDGENALMGSATLINVGKGTSGAYNAVAIKHFVEKDDFSSTEAREKGKAYTLHNMPGSSYPNLNGQVQRKDSGQGKIVYSKAINKEALLTHNGGGFEAVQVNRALFRDENDATYNKLEQKTLGINEDQFPAAVTLSAILTTHKIIGEYVIDPELRAASDWIVTMPTKHFFTNPDTTDPDGTLRGVGQYGFLNDYADSAASINFELLVQDGGQPVMPKAVKPTEGAFLPFTHTAFHRTPLVDTAEIFTFNREEGQNKIDAEFDFSPSVGLPDVGLNAEANVLHFSKDADKKIFNSVNEHMLNVATDFTAGWATITFNKGQYMASEKGCKRASTGTLASDMAFCLKGLPVIGVAATRYVNSALYIEGKGDVLSNYLGMVDLTYKRDNDLGAETP